MISCGPQKSRGACNGEIFFPSQTGEWKLPHSPSLSGTSELTITRKDSPLVELRISGKIAMMKREKPRRRVLMMATGPGFPFLFRRVIGQPNFGVIGRVAVPGTIPMMISLRVVQFLQGTGKNRPENHLVKPPVGQVVRVIENDSLFVKPVQNRRKKFGYLRVGKLRRAGKFHGRIEPFPDRKDRRFFPSKHGGQVIIFSTERPMLDVDSRKSFIVKGFQFRT